MSNRPHIPGLPTNGVWIDDEGLIHVPGKAPQPVIGPTSGSDYERLKSAEREAAENKLQMERDLRSVWSCTECRRKFSALSWSEKDSIIRRSPAFKANPVTGALMGMPVCPFCLDRDPRSAMPIVRVQDAVDLKRAPGGRI